MNKIVLTGRLVRDPEIRYSQQTNTAIARYTLAVDRMYKREGEPRAVPAAGDKDSSHRPHPDRQLHKQGRTEGLYHRCGGRITGVLRKQSRFCLCRTKHFC